MSIIHELHLENKESTDSNQRNERKKKKKKERNFCSCYDIKLAWVPKHSFKIKLGGNKDESRNKTSRSCPHNRKPPQPDPFQGMPKA